ncbi:hypothetical protein BH10PSE8_BH10PSE8_17160 [soil metagenome]
MALPRSILTMMACLLGGMTAPVSARGPDLCIKDRMETQPASVEAPCTERLESGKLGPALKAQAFYIRGRGRHRTGQIKLAAKDYDEAIKLQPKNSEFYVDRANTRFRADDREAAIADLETSLRLNARNTRALIIFGNMLINAGQPMDGLKLIDQALSIDPKQPFGLLFRLEAYAAMSRWPEALKDADTLVALPPERINRAGYVDSRGQLLDFHIVALEARAKIHEQKRQFAEAEADLNAAVAYKADTQAYQARAAFLANQMHREADALRDLEIVAAARPDAFWVQYGRAQLLLRSKRWADAIAASDRALDIDGDDGGAYEVRGMALKALGRFDEAFSDLTAALEREPSLIPDHITSLESAGYFPSRQLPTEMTPLLRDALKACSLDPACREH